MRSSKRERSKTKKRAKLLADVLSIMALGGVLLAAHPAWAGHIEGNVCMGTLFTNLTGQKLNCTANDVVIARATSVTPNSCESGTVIPSLTATFLVELQGGGASQTRYDVGLYFNIAGGQSARGGTCSLNAIQTDAGVYFRNLDGDDCGDINTALNPFFPTVVFTNVTCTGDGSTNCDGGECLRLPNCTSWRQPGSNTVCSDSNFSQGGNALAPLTPGTTSKCKCDDTFTVPVKVTPAKASLKKNPTQAVVTYAVTVENDGAHAANLTTLSDDTYGDITTTGHDGVVRTDCAVPQNNIAVNAQYACTFDVLVSAPGSADPVTDVVTATMVDTVNGTSAKPTGSATVTVDLPQTP